jgi:DEAD/DEAH box helicase domain-containing protein
MPGRRHAKAVKDAGEGRPRGAGSARGASGARAGSGAREGSGARAGGGGAQASPWRALLAGAREEGRVVASEREPGREAESEPVPGDLHAELRAALARMGIERLYSHQAEAVAAAWEATTIVTTGTASGKSLCFNLPTLDVLCRDRRARALYLYPTKALAQDQARALERFGLSGRVRPALYVGDTPQSARAEIRRRANIVLSNPDMLHVGILPRHDLWAELFANLAVVVVDEAHVYRGVFGSHVAGVLRRLRRIARAYGTEPRFLLASATIANPAQLAERLTGFEDVRVIDRDGAPARGREIAMWNPPLEDAELGIRRSVMPEAAELVARLVREGSRVICFMRSRKRVELLSEAVRTDLRRTDPDLAERVTPYRAGYTPAQRREIEERLHAGELRAVVSTNALELGIDVGELDAAVVVTFPGTVASLRQMWGRAGRRAPGLAVYMAGEDALDQFFCRHPREFLERPVEAAILDPLSPQIHAWQTICAAHEAPLSGADAELWGPQWERTAELLVSMGELVKRRPTARMAAALGASGRAARGGEATGAEASREPAAAAPGGPGAAAEVYVPRRPGEYPAAVISLRSASAGRFEVVDVTTGERLGEVELERAHSTLHAGAVYLHLGRSYEVQELDLDHRRALVTPFEHDWYTQPKRETETTIVRLDERREALGVRLSVGRITVSETVVAYQRRRVADHAPLGLVMLDLPQTSFHTQALWYELDPPALAGELPLEAMLGALHATEHAQIAVLPLLAMCDRWDIGGLSTNLHPQTGGPAIFIYDGYPGGVGIAEAAFASFEQLSHDALALIAECPCTGGCPSCVQSPKCGNLNEPLSKAGARLLLEGMARAASTHPAAPRSRAGAGVRAR